MPLDTERWRPLIAKALGQCRLFRSMGEEAVLPLLEHNAAFVRQYAREDVVALEAEPLFSLGVVLTGRVQAQHTYLSGASSPLATLGVGDTIGEAVIFSKQARYPATIVALAPCAILFLPKQTLAGMLSDSTLMTNFIGILSDRIVLLSGRIRMLSHRTLRQRIADQLLGLARGGSQVTLPVSRREMAEAMGVARPSLSREMAAMKRDGLIDFSDRNVTIVDSRGLLRCLETE